MSTFHDFSKHFDYVRLEHKKTLLIMRFFDIEI